MGHVSVMNRRDARLSVQHTQWIAYPSMQGNRETKTSSLFQTTQKASELEQSFSKLSSSSSTPDSDQQYSKPIWDAPAQALHLSLCDQTTIKRAFLLVLRCALRHAERDLWPLTQADECSDTEHVRSWLQSIFTTREGCSGSETHAARALAHTYSQCFPLAWLLNTPVLKLTANTVSLHPLHSWVNQILVEVLQPIKLQQFQVQAHFKTTGQRTAEIH